MDSSDDWLTLQVWVLQSDPWKLQLVSWSLATNRVKPSVGPGLLMRRLCLFRTECNAGLLQCKIAVTGLISITHSNDAVYILHATYSCTLLSKICRVFFYFLLLRLQLRVILVITYSFDFFFWKLERIHNNAYEKLIFTFLKPVWHLKIFFKDVSLTVYVRRQTFSSQIKQCSLCKL